MVAQVDEDDPAMVAAPVNPTEQVNRLPDLVGSNFPAVAAFLSHWRLRPARTFH